MIAMYYFGPVLFTEEDRIARRRAISAFLKRGFDPRKPWRFVSPSTEDDVGDLDGIATAAVHIATSGWYRSPDDLILK